MAELDVVIGNAQEDILGKYSKDNLWEVQLEINKKVFEDLESVQSLANFELIVITILIILVALIGYNLTKAVMKLDEIDRTLKKTIKRFDDIERNYKKNKAKLKKVEKVIEL